MPETIRDHEKRVRLLESMQWKILAVALLGSGIGGFLAWLWGNGVL